MNSFLCPNTTHSPSSPSIITTRPTLKAKRQRSLEAEGHLCHPVPFGYRAAAAALPSGRTPFLASPFGCHSTLAKPTRPLPLGKPSLPRHVYSIYTPLRYDLAGSIAYEGKDPLRRRRRQAAAEPPSCQASKENNDDCIGFLPLAVFLILVAFYTPIGIAIHRMIRRN